MVEWLYFVILILSILIGSVLVVAGIGGLKPRGNLIIVFFCVELSLFVQLAVSTGIVLAGAQAQVSTVEFFGYLLVALLIPPAAVIWALAEQSRWSTVVMGFASLTIAIMLIRMNQIWTGIPFGN
ncbi:MAG: hypothetical protein RL537_401 [Actinomycetota bacterium]